MSLLSDGKKFEKESSERPKAWKILRTIPEYISDYEAMKKDDLGDSSASDKAIMLRERWGFFPLADPAGNGNFEFFGSFLGYSDEVSRSRIVVDCDGLDYFYRIDDNIYDPNDELCPDFEPSDWLEVKIDLRVPTQVLLGELKRIIKHAKNLYDITKENTASHDHRAYLVGLLKKMNLSRTEIIERLMPEDLKDKDYYDNEKEAERKKISKRLKKAE